MGPFPFPAPPPILALTCLICDSFAMRGILCSIFGTLYVVTRCARPLFETQSGPATVCPSGKCFQGKWGRGELRKAAIFEPQKN